MPNFPALTSAIAGLPLPSAVVDLEAFDANAERAEKWVAQSGRTLPIRVATKSVRVPALIQRVLARSGWQGVMCFAAGEVELLHAEGIDDFLLAYPTVEPHDIQALRRVHDAGATIAVVVDCPAHVACLEDAFGDAERPLSVVVDVDASLRTLGAHLGVRRSPVRDALAAARVFDACKRTQPVGLMAYEAQVAGLPDASAFHRVRNFAARQVRKKSERLVAERRRAVVAHLNDRGYPTTLVNGGGTGSLDSTPRDPSVTEVTMGSGLFCPHSFDGFSAVKMEPACFFALAVARASDAGFVTCAGGGYIASGAAGKDRLPLPVYPEGLSLLDAEGAGEVQTPLACGAARPSLGDPVFFRHAKAGELMERFGAVHLVKGDRVVETAKTYRGHGAAFF